MLTITNVTVSRGDMWFLVNPGKTSSYDLRRQSVEFNVKGHSFSKAGEDSGCCTCFVQKWLSPSKHLITLSGSGSRLMRIISRVPQGSALGPIMFMSLIINVKINKRE